MCVPQKKSHSLSLWQNSAERGRTRRYFFVWLKQSICRSKEEGIDPEKDECVVDLARYLTERPQVVNGQQFRPKCQGKSFVKQRPAPASIKVSYTLRRFSLGAVSCDRHLSPQPPKPSSVGSVYRDL